MESALGSGTCFTLELPAMQDDSSGVGLGNESTAELSIDVDRIEMRETLDTVVVDRMLIDENEERLGAALSEHEEFTPFELLLAVGAQVR